FSLHPDESWQVIKTLFYDFFGKVVPNRAHEAIARLESEGFIKAVVTQNIDNLHQEAGCKNVIEFHGNYKYLVCPKCRRRYNAEEELMNAIPPHCPADQQVLKPDFVFFGEPIPEDASEAAFHEASRADVFILVGTTGEVMPANMIPRLAKQNGATIIEVNTDSSSYTSDVTDIFLQGRAGDILPELVETIFQ
ncbi:MAG TPA: Sir2 family NAD-dependent protein deacetylase, partial [Bacteroidales bacterium]|nr:Sir2 family NAD-dependent protein deacetylase [Bacteroidales bacterium]